VSEYAARLALKARLKRTWIPFFERYGNFTAIQLAAIPAVLDGQNIVVSAPTAQGKTEAAIVPLVERFRSDAGLTILYLTPTRALANDLLARLGSPFQSLGLSLAIKTHDLNTFDPQHPAYCLITTPESVDSLLTSQARVFANLRAVVLDELHLFDGTPRGDQLRVLLNRIRRIRAYAFAQMQTTDAALQYIALSATLSDPAAAARYFPVDQVIHVAGQRPLEAEVIAMQPDTADTLIDYLYTFRARGWHKALVFCNSRAEVESYAAAIRQNSPFGDAVYVHYSNIAPVRRREIEQQFSQAEVAVCCATSTLELGIDIGTIDVVLLIGPPGDEASFVQRIGRGNRRQAVIRIACFYRTPLEKLLFETLCAPQVDAVAPFSTPSSRFSVCSNKVLRDRYG
jgi:ATP-dependent Lhr-like helicase